ncbi:hypothetical protein [Anaerocolumna jejuensis]|uniref:hypothetical protein n=1 Tax=Anaerocolumna jejuensis TaxID=259063 RepID=UPI003F7B92F6
MNSVLNKNLDISFEGIHDHTGYLFSFAKTLAAAVNSSPYKELTEDIVATSGFAFRMWVAADLCPSATSIWSFDQQKPWVENGGLLCGYVGRYWGQDEIEEEKQQEAITLIKDSIDRGIPAVCWDIGMPEWGLITGYNEEEQIFYTLTTTCKKETMPYNLLGKREIPILSVLTITGKTEKEQEKTAMDTIKLALSHLEGEEWCENVKGIEAYPELIAHFNEKFNAEASWNLEYYLGNYGGLKYYAWRYFEKHGFPELADCYKAVYKAWEEAYRIKASEDITKPEVREGINKELLTAYKAEQQGMDLMRSYIKVSA